MVTRAISTMGLATLLAACTSSGVSSQRSSPSPSHASKGIAAATASSPASPEAGSVVNPAFLEQYASTFRFRAGSPTAIKVSPDGKAVLFLRSGPRSRVMDLYEFDVEKGSERVILTAEQILSGGEENLTPEELARRERMRQIARGISAYELSDDGAKLLVPLSGRLFVVERESRKVTELKSEAGYPIDPRFSPDGSKVACVRDGDVYVIEIASGKETRLTTKTGETVTNGLAEFVAQEEMDRFAGYWWSPDGTQIAYEQSDTAGLETFTIADPVNPDKPAQTWPYPRPGKANAKVRLGVISAGGGETTWIEWDHAKYEYLASVKWTKNAPLTLVVLNRAQTEIAVLAGDVQSGGVTPLHAERDDAWINIHQSVPAWLEDGSGFLWLSEGSGETQLQFIPRAGGEPRALLGKDANLIDLTHFDAKTGVTHLATTAGDPSQTHVLRFEAMRAISTGPDNKSARTRQLTSGSNVNGFLAGEVLSTYVVSTTDLAGAREWSVFRADGSKAGQIKGVGEAPLVDLRIELAQAKPIGRDAYRAAIIRPSDFDPKKKYPVILSVYAGPHVNVVQASSWPHLLNQWFADQGFIVAMLDGRGTPRRGRAWERQIRRDLGGITLANQVSGLKTLGEMYPEMDMSRVGVYGWSFGGYFSAMAAMRRPDVFKAACAGAPVADWRDYDTCYTERYMGFPVVPGGVALPEGEQDATKAYDENSVLTYCKDLKVPLMIIHGTADDNVYFMHSLKMADALFKAGKDYDFLVLPGFTHMVPDPVVTTNLYSRVAKFFKRELGEAR